MNIRHFLRMARWARKPPSEGRIKFFFGICALCLLLFAIDKLVGWPDWLTLENTPKGRINR